MRFQPIICKHCLINMRQLGVSYILNIGFSFWDHIKLLNELIGIFRYLSIDY